MITPLYKPMKKNGTTMYVFPSVSEDKNFETQNENYKMFLSHFVLVNFPKYEPKTVFDFDITFEQNSSSISPNSFKDSLVESLRNYVANHEVVIRNSKINGTDFFYDTFELHTTTEKIFWKWCKKLGLIDFEIADTTNEYFGSDNKYNNLGNASNNDYFREYLWKERSTDIYSLLDVQLYNITGSNKYFSFTLDRSGQFKPGDKLSLNVGGIDDINNIGILDTSVLVITEVLSSGILPNELNDIIVVEADLSVDISDFGNILDLEVYSVYERFVQFISEVTGVNNVQLADKAYTETFAYISHQHGQIPYSLWNISDDNNYKPNLKFPILPAEIQAEIQGGENINNPILTNPSNYPGDIWGQFDTNGFVYESESGNVNKRYGYYYGVSALTNVQPTLKYPDFDGSTIDGLTLNLNLSDYAQPTSYIYPIDSFNEYCATSFNNLAPKDFEFNGILWYYTIQDVTANNVEYATNLYGVEFLDTPENDILFMKTKIPTAKKLVSNGTQDGNAYTFTIDTNIEIDSDTAVDTFDPEKIYSLFGMELYYEALTRITYFNDHLSNFISSNMELSERVNSLTGLVYTQQSLESVRLRMDNLENLLNIFSTLQIGDSDTITTYLDTSVNPPLLRLTSIDKQYGHIYQYDTKEMFTEFLNINGKTQVNKIEKIIPVVSGKDFLVVINNNDNNIPPISAPYDTSILQDTLSIVLEKDLQFKQKMDIIITTKNNKEVGSSVITNMPINDKKLDLFINYNDGLVNIKKSIGQFSLPVLQNGLDLLTIKNEPHVGLNHIPVWKARNVYYNKLSSTIRVFSFVVEDNLLGNLGITQKSRILLDNFLLENNPQNPGDTYKDFSTQYNITEGSVNPIQLKDKIIDVDIELSGTGYTNGIITYVGSTYTVDLDLVVNISGSIVSATVINSTGISLDETVTLTGFGDGNADVQFIAKKVSRIDISIDMTLDPEINTILSNYDNYLNISTIPLNTYLKIDNFLKIMPTISFLRGYKISIVRISDIDLPVNFIDERYNIKVEKI